MSVIVYAQRRPLTANCSTCDHKANPDGGYCYMFRDQPEGDCYKHTGKSNITSLQRLIESAQEQTPNYRSKAQP